MSRHKILVLAEAANPEWVSVPLVGWSHAHALSQVADVHVVTQIRNKAAIERFGWKDGREFTAIDSEAVAKALWKLSDLVRGGAGKGWTAVTALQAPSYLYFEHLFWKKFESDLRAGKWDLVHRITPLSPTTPSFIAGRLKKIGVPYVVGPLNGGVPWPKEFDAERRAEKEWLSYVREAYRLVPGYAALRKHAAALVVGSQDTAKQMPKWCRERLIYVPENAIDPDRFPLEAGPKAGDSTIVGERPLRVAFVGRLVPYKGGDMLIEASAPLIRAGKVTIDLIGDGPEKERLIELTKRLGIESGVEFAGWVPHEELQGRLGRADVFGFPSIREFGGGVVLEAMALGVVPVVVGYGGPKELVTDDTGVALSIGPRDSIVIDLRAALESLADDRARLGRMSVAGRERVKGYFTWPKKAEQMLGIYDWVLGRGPKPQLGMPLGT